jgi:hypothetical protein
VTVYFFVAKGETVRAFLFCLTAGLALTLGCNDDRPSCAELKTQNEELAWLIRQKRES